MSTRSRCASVEAQLDAVLEDLPVAAAKTGMLGHPGVVELVAAAPGRRPPGRRPRPGRHQRGGARRRIGGARLRRAPPAGGRRRARPTPTRPPRCSAATGTPRDLAAALSDLGCAVVVTGGPGTDPAGASCTDWLAHARRAGPRARAPGRRHRQRPRHRVHVQRRAGGRARPRGRPRDRGRPGPPPTPSPRCTAAPAGASAAAADRSPTPSPDGSTDDPSTAARPPRPLPGARRPRTASRCPSPASR